MGAFNTSTAHNCIRRQSLSRILLVGLTLNLYACDKALPPSTSLEVAAVGIHSGAISDNAELFTIGSINHGGSMWRTTSQERIFNWNHKSGEYSTIVAADFSHNAAWAITATPFDLVLWNTQSGEGERFWSAPGEILDATLGPDARFALLGLSDHNAVIFDIRRGGILQTFTHQNRVRSVDLSQDGTLALTGSEDYTANLWDTQSGKKLYAIKHDDDVQLVKLSPDGKLALSVAKYDKALIWQTSDGQAIGEIPLGKEEQKRGMRFTTATFSADGNQLLTGRPDQTVDLWDVKTLSKISSWRLPKRDAWKPTSAAVIHISFSAEPGTFYALASNGFIHQLKLAESVPQ
ncbi:hypothetical protein TDB9533_01874 [Thalassocella blandensis]|nr:hypothetical protein TDB9533_01874 [Thalassocella blandensis]